MKALTLRQPWLWLHLNAGKQPENRSRRWGYRGPLLLHAASAMTAKDYDEAVAFARDRRRYDGPIPPRDSPLLVRGAIAAWCMVVRHTGIQEGDEFPWSMAGKHGMVLADVTPTPLVACRGHQGLWTAPDGVVAEIDRRRAETELPDDWRTRFPPPLSPNVDPISSNPSSSDLWLAALSVSNSMAESWRRYWRAQRRGRRGQPDLPPARALVRDGVVVARVRADAIGKLACLHRIGDRVTIVLPGTRRKLTARFVVESF